MAIYAIPDRFLSQFTYGGHALDGPISERDWKKIHAFKWHLFEKGISPERDLKVFNDPVRDYKTGEITRSFIVKNSITGKKERCCFLYLNKADYDELCKKLIGHTFITDNWYHHDVELPKMKDDQYSAKYALTGALEDARRENYRVLADAIEAAGPVLHGEGSLGSVSDLFLDAAEQAVKKGFDPFYGANCKNSEEYEIAKGQSKDENEAAEKAKVILIYNEFQNMPDVTLRAFVMSELVSRAAQDGKDDFVLNTDERKFDPAFEGETEADDLDGIDKAVKQAVENNDADIVHAWIDNRVNAEQQWDTLTVKPQAAEQAQSRGRGRR